MSEGYKFDPTVLREYDIRGIVGQNLGHDDAHAVGRAIGTIVAEEGGSSVATGYDGRHSSPELEKALVDGLLESGMTVKRMGRGPTPMLYYTAKMLDTDGGVMITGSHNPPQYNGIKMLTRDKGALYGDHIRRIGRIAAEGAYAEGKGQAQKVDILDNYVERLMRDFTAGDRRRLSVAWDAGNGAAGDAVAKMAARLPGQHETLFTDIDGDFPNHHPDPSVPNNLSDLIHCVREKNCDVGLAFDGDGDRLGVVDDKGRIISGDQLLALYAQDVLKTHPGAPIIADVKASLVLFEEIERLGGKPVMWKTGHSLIKAKMKEIESPLAGEMSGHIIFADKYYGYDDALYAAVRVLDYLARRNEPLSELYDRLPQTETTPEVRFPCSEERKFKVIEEVRDRLADSDAEVNAIDGVRVSTQDGWWLLRASNTQDVLVARCEAKTPEGLERLKQLLVDQLEKSGLESPSFEAAAH